MDIFYVRKLGEIMVICTCVHNFKILSMLHVPISSFCEIFKNMRLTKDLSILSWGY